MKFRFIIAALLCLGPSLASAQVRYDTFFLKPLPSGGVGAVSGLATVCSGAGLATTAATITGNVATLTMASNPLTAGLVNGRDILLFGFSGGDTFFNASWTLTAVSSTQLQFAITHGNWTASSNGAAVMKPTASAGCAPLATIYSDQGLTATITQPFPDDGKSNIGFFAAPGNYWVAYSASGLNPMPMNFVTLAPTVPINLSTQTTGLLNLATQVSGTLPGANYAAVNLAGGNNPGGVFGTLPAASVSQINLAASGNGGVTGVLPVANEGTGTPAASKYVDGGTGAWTTLPSASGVSEATWASSQPSAPGAAATAKAYAEMILPSAHTLIRFVGFLGGTITTCSTTVPVVSFYDETGATALSSLTLSNTGNQLYDSGALNVAMTAGHTFSIRITTAGDANCQGASPSTWTAFYK